MHTTMPYADDREEPHVSVAIRLRGLDSGLFTVPVSSVLAGSLADPEAVVAVASNGRNIPGTGGYVAIDGLSDTAFVLCPAGTPPVPRGWHVFKAQADDAGLGAMRRVARSLNPISPEEEAVWDGWLDEHRKRNPSRVNNVDGTPSNPSRK